MSFGRLAEIWPELQSVDPKIAAQIEIDARYASYLKRQDADVAARVLIEAVKRIAA